MRNLNPYFYKIKVDRVIDGDTIDAYFDLGFNITHKVRVRLMNLDTPETYRPKSQKELDAGNFVKNFFAETLAAKENSLFCESTNIDLYGRSSGIVYFKDEYDRMEPINPMIQNFMDQNKLNKSDL